ncbi:hypothetical protein AAFF_G00188240 [Aldrovandia affinis]|uniref:Uncharacterized protein n=1 Tax=Aldrovandia affinis TaxID=143900 RepID=A0AAD7SY04_9TELE|nr:hypothetical protein AAFF_G00188240 [Aldrovandia affinis]
MPYKSSNLSFVINPTLEYPDGRSVPRLFDCRGRTLQPSQTSVDQWRCSWPVITPWPSGLVLSQGRQSEEAGLSPTSALEATKKVSESPS